MDANLASPASPAPTVADGRIQCALCDFKGHSLLDHVQKVHGLTPAQYSADHGATLSPLVLERVNAGVRRSPAPAPQDLTVDIGGWFQMPVDTGITPEQTCTRPSGFLWATKGSSLKVHKRLTQSLARGRNVFLWGMPGTGKDAAIQAYFNDVRKPVIVISFKPGTDISPYFYTRAILADGSTAWEYGHVWDAIVNGVEGRDGVRRAPVILLSDADRADQAQLEWFRLLTDSIEGRILSPEGKTVPLIPGVQFVCTANSCGSGDARGRMASAGVMDASIVNRLGMKIEAAYLHWEDEARVLRGKFPDLAASAPWLFEGPVGSDSSDTKTFGKATPGEIGKATAALRDAIDSEDIYCEFTHRDLVNILERAEDILYFKRGNKVPKNLLAAAFSVWLEGLQNDERLAAKRLVDPHVGAGSFSEDSTDDQDLADC